ncbi:MAG: hypothetical protein JST63_06730 [Bacteroidetes bacterium]|nr:hypothetical protein [Bacteroidota bacterium]
MKDVFLLPYLIDETITLSEKKRNLMQHSLNHNHISKDNGVFRGSEKINSLENERNEVDSSSAKSSCKSIYPQVLMPPEQEAYLKVSKYDFL